MKLSLGSKISISTVLTILFFGTIATLSVYILVQKTVIDLEKDGLQLLAKNSTREINRLFFDTQQIAETIAIQPELVAYLQEGDYDYDVNRLLDFYNIADRFSSIYIMDRSGDTLAATDKSFIGQNYAFRDYFQTALYGKSAIDLAVGVTTKETGYYISTPVRDNDGAILGVVVIKMKPELISQLVVPSGLTGVGHVMLVDNYGVIIYSDKKDRVYKSLGGLNEFERQEVSKLKKYADLKLEGLDYELVYEKIKSGKKNGIIEFYDKADREEEILVFNRIGNFPFFLVYEEETESFSSSAVNTSMLLSLFVALAAIMAAIIIVALSRNYLAPIRAIKQALDDIGSNKFGGRVIVKTGDELGDLAKALNDMMSKIENSQADFNQKIKKRTSDLEKFNRLMVGREMRMMELKKEVDRLQRGISRSKQMSCKEGLTEGLDFEEKVIRELESFYIFKVNNSDILKKNRQKILRLLKILIEDSKRHYNVINEIIEKYERK